MKYYQVVLNGENFLIRVDGEKTLMGFYTTKFVEAESAKEAELKAVDVLKQDEDLLNLTLNRSGDIYKAPTIYLDTIYEITKSSMEDDQGKAWYSMEIDDKDVE